MKISSVVYHVSTFALASIGVLTVAAILSLAERNLRTSAAEAVDHPAEVSVEASAKTYTSDQPVQQGFIPSATTSSYIPNGYIGTFGYNAPLPQAVSEPEVLPAVATLPTAAPAGSRPVVSSEAVAPVARAKVPFIRVGLYEVADDEEVRLSVNRRSRIVLEDGTVAKSNVKRNKEISIYYNSQTNTYSVTRGSWYFTTDQPVRILPKRPHSVTTIHSYENRPAWNQELNDNQFLGRVEVNDGWVVNQLGIENYVKGVAEAGDTNDKAYLKSLYTAARSYAYYHYLHPTKHADDPYLLDSTPNDQVYRGYGFTKRAPNIAAAVDETRGRIVHYEGEPVITPYFSQTDGRTRSWGEVWYGEREYLQSVDDPCCTDEEQLGHGVGYSAKGGRYFAEEIGWGWKKILKYYYKGIRIPQLWN